MNYKSAYLSNLFKVSHLLQQNRKKNKFKTIFKIILFEIKN